MQAQSHGLYCFGLVLSTEFAKTQKAVSEATWLFCLLLALVLKGILKDMYDLTFCPPCYQLEVCGALLPLNMFVFLSWQHLLLAFASLPGRLELPTLRFTSASRSNQLSYGSLPGMGKVIICGPTRTLRLLAVRSNQLSHETHWFHLAPGPASLPFRAPIC